MLFVASASQSGVFKNAGYYLKYNIYSRKERNLNVLKKIINLHKIIEIENVEYENFGKDGYQ